MGMVRETRDGRSRLERVTDTVRGIASGPGFIFAHVLWFGIWIGANADVAIRRAARIGDCWYINPHNTMATIERQMDVYKRALDDYKKPFPNEVPMRREVFVAPTRGEAIRRARQLELI